MTWSVRVSGVDRDEATALLVRNTVAEPAYKESKHGRLIMKNAAYAAGKLARCSPAGTKVDVEIMGHTEPNGSGNVSIKLALSAPVVEAKAAAK